MAAPPSPTRMIWTADSNASSRPPDWSLTGLMLLWSDGSPVHAQQLPFERVGTAWESRVRLSRSTRTGTRWLSLQLRLEADVSARWAQDAVDPRARAATLLDAYLKLREWHDDDLGVLYLK